MVRRQVALSAGVASRGRGGVLWQRRAFFLRALRRRRALGAEDAGLQGLGAPDGQRTRHKPHGEEGPAKHEPDGSRGARAHLLAMNDDGGGLGGLL